MARSAANVADPSQRKVGKVDLGAGRERADQEFDQPYRAAIGCQQVPVAIDDNRRGAARLNPNKATALKNGDEPVTRFSAAPTSR